MKTLLAVRRPGIFLAADFSTLGECLGILEKIADCIDGIKIGYVLLGDPEFGKRVIRMVKEATGLPVLVDTKIHDVRHIACSMYENARHWGADGVTVWHNSGVSAIADLVAYQDDVSVVVLTELTDPGACSIPDEFRRGIDVARSARADAIQVPGNKPKAIRIARATVGASLPIFCCGIGVQGGDPVEAIRAGADYLIIGRMIIREAEPRDALKRIRERLSMATVAR